jgi:hypothetical protein
MSFLLNNLFQTPTCRCYKTNLREWLHHHHKLNYHPLFPISAIRLTLESTIKQIVWSNFKTTNPLLLLLFLPSVQIKYMHSPHFLPKKNAFLSDLYCIFTIVVKAAYFDCLKNNYYSWPIWLPKFCMAHYCTVSRTRDFSAQLHCYL